MKSEQIECGRLYKDLAFLMPIITPPEEYAEEASYWRAVLREKLGEGRHDILELGSGGGHNLSHLTGDFVATAVDLSEPMLAQCRKLNFEVETHVGDMRHVRLGRRFSAVLIHDAISLMVTETDLSKTFETAAAHLKPGGIIITAPDHFAESFYSPTTETATHHAQGMDVTYFEFTHDPDPADTAIESIMVFLINDQKGLRVEYDRHIMGLFPKSTWIHLLEQAGFAVEQRSFVLKDFDRPYELLVGVMR
jgi:SAM-dependent methyltransferase